MLLYALCSESAYYLSLRSDGGMVRPWNPAGIEAPHTSTAHEDILDAVIQHVSHVQDTRYVGRGDDDSVSRAMVRL